LKVAQVVPSMNVGGVERGAIDLALHLNKQGVDNFIVSSGGRLLETSTNLGVKHILLNVCKKSLSSLFSIGKMRKIINNENVDIVHARSRVPAWISFFATRSSSAHFITTAHGVYKNKFFSEVMGWGKVVICPSKVVARHLRNNFGVPDEKIIIINRWVDTEAFYFTDYNQRKTSNTVVAVGRISPTKGYEYLIEAFKRVVRINPYLELHIVGSPDKSKMRYYKHLQTLVNRYSLQYNVKFIEYKSDVAGILSSARVLVAPSVTEESFGRVIVEAFSCGVPVIATKVGGYNEIIEDREDAILVDPCNSDQIAEGILKILEDPQYAANLTVKARSKVERLYTIEKCLSQVDKVYEKVLKTTRIAVIKLSSFGDLVLIIPALKLLRDKNSKSYIVLVTSKRYSSLFFDCPYIDELISLDDSCKSVKAIREASRILRRKSFDYIIDFQNNKISHLLSFLAFPRYSFGYGLRWGFLLSKRIAYDRNLDPLSSQEKILQFLGLKFDEKKLIFWDKKTTESLNLPDGNLIGINVSASRRWKSKNWALKNIVKLIELIIKNIPQSYVVLFGDEYSQEISQGLVSTANHRVFNLCGKTSIADLPAALMQLKAFITPDTATLHLAAALGVPVIAFFGPTDYRRHAVASSDLHVLTGDLPCLCCYKPDCKFSKESLCLGKITPSEVYAKLKSILKDKGIISF
jgi:glycosyltransferase involved in cell wall biosynthesis/ADP-heptose:LPS heptosyltransferase